MNADSEAIKIFCSKLCVGGAEPLSAREWGDLSVVLKNNNVRPAELLNYTKSDFLALSGGDEMLSDRLLRLTDRSASLAFELSEYANIGIYTVTRSDDGYPVRLKKSLGAYCPPVLYYAGDISLFNGRYAGFVGSRSAVEADEKFTQNTVRKTAYRGYGVVSGGARGVDSFAEAEGIRRGCAVTEFTADSMKKRMRSYEVVRAVQDGMFLLVSAVSPNAPFSAKYALARNRFIYSLSSGTVVVRSDLNKGGTWSGATDNLRNGWCAEFCWNNPNYAGNTALIGRGAIPIDDTFDGDISGFEPPEQIKFI